MYARTSGGGMRIASHRPPLSPIALEGGSADGGEVIRPPYLIYATGLPATIMWPTPPYPTLAMLPGAAGFNAPSELSEYAISFGWVCAGMIPLPKCALDKS